MVPYLNRSVKMTRYLISVLFMVFLVSVVSYPQSIRTYGLKLGTASAIQTWNYHNTPYGIPLDLATKQRWGIDVGAFVEVLDVPYLSVLGELHYIQKGYSITLPVSTPANPDGIGHDTTIRPRIDYLSIPMLLRVRFEAASFIPYLLLGPRADFRIGQTERTFEKFNHTDIGISGGVGIAVPLSHVRGLLIEFRYSPSITYAYEGEFVHVKNRSFELLLGIER